ncbi:MAG: MaoC/PaaZ C-terminal domain-containing protein [Galbitalea sp.]
MDPEAAARIGQVRPILQGLCTLALVTLPLARSLDAHPADLKRLGGRFTGVVIPGDELVVRHDVDGRFESAITANPSSPRERRCSDDRHSGARRGWIGV